MSGVDTIDAELSALGALVELLRELPELSQRRVLVCALDSFEGRPLSAPAVDDSRVAADRRRARGTSRTDVVALVCAARSGMTAADVASRTGQSRTAASTMLRDAANNQLLRRAARGRYVAPGGAS